MTVCLFVCLLLQNLSILNYVSQSVCMYVCLHVLGHNFEARFLIFPYYIIRCQNREGPNFNKISSFFT